MKEGVYKETLPYLLMVILAYKPVGPVRFGNCSARYKDRPTFDRHSALTGIAFAVFCAVMGIPIARWGDRGNRVTIISLTVALWSVAVVACGIARNFTQLMLLRIAVAVGEARCIPSALSLIADEFSRAQPPRAASRYMLGASLALMQC